MKVPTIFGESARKAILEQIGDHEYTVSHDYHGEIYRTRHHHEVNLYIASSPAPLGEIFDAF